MTVKQFVRDVVLIGSATTLGDTALCKFVHDYEKKRPLLSSEEILAVFPQSAKGLGKHKQAVVDSVIDVICALIDNCVMFGIAVDGAVDHVKHEHILVMILYVLNKDFALPPLYHPTKQAWNGKVMASEMMKALVTLFGRERVAKLRYFMVDGLMVNHVARVEAEGILKELFATVTALGERDWENFVHALGNLVNLPCAGHLVQNVATDAFRSWNDTALMNFKKAFKNIFYGMGVNHKAFYGAVALDEHLAALGAHEEAMEAIKTFERYYGALASSKFTDTEKQAAVDMCVATLTTLERFSAAAASMKLQVLAKHEDTHKAWKENWDKAITELREHEITPLIKAPQLGGVTRWTYDKYRSIKFIVSQYAVIRKFLALESKKESASVSVREAHRLLEEQPIVAQGKQFLDETKEFCSVLTQLSDPSTVCTATHVAGALNRLYELQDKPDEVIPSYVKTALRYHCTRVKETSELPFFYFVQWFDVEYVMMAKLMKTEPPPVEMINDIFRRGAIFNISQAEWDEYLSAQHHYSYDEGHTDRSWWVDVGSRTHPAVYEVARHVIYVPAVVLACDQLMSVMMARYNARHGQLLPETGFHPGQQEACDGNWR